MEELKAPFPYFGLIILFLIFIFIGKGGFMNIETVKRFWSKVEKTESCWNWIGSKRNKGYGAFVWADKDGKIIQGRAHRFSYELRNGAILGGLCVLHKCDCPACVNPDHLFLGTKAENNADMKAKGRHVSGGTHCGKNGKWKSGTSHWNYKISDRIVSKIRLARALGASYGMLVKKFNLSIGYLFRICNNQARSNA